MIHQRATKDAKWHRYLVSLPTRFSDPVWWPPALVHAMRGTNLHGAVVDRLAWLDAMWTQYVQPLVRARPDTFPAATFTRYGSTTGVGLQASKHMQALCGLAMLLFFFRSVCSDSQLVLAPWLGGGRVRTWSCHIPERPSSGHTRLSPLVRFRGS